MVFVIKSDNMVEIEATNLFVKVIQDQSDRKILLVHFKIAITVNHQILSCMCTLLFMWFCIKIPWIFVIIKVPRSFFTHTKLKSQEVLANLKKGLIKC